MSLQNILSCSNISHTPFINSHLLVDQLQVLKQSLIYHMLLQESMQMPSSNSILVKDTWTPYHKQKRSSVKGPPQTNKMQIQIHHSQLSSKSLCSILSIPLELSLPSWKMHAMRVQLHPFTLNQKCTRFYSSLIFLFKVFLNFQWLTKAISSKQQNFQFAISTSYSC